MRFISLRGANLASFAGPFELDFTAEPLASAGIFVISGPTGAGKSTLLDAICLALFDRLPRLQGADSSGSVGRNESAILIRYDDVRGILRHGAAEAYAEVQFIGQDNRAYSARWEVRRARGRPDGTLQPQKITLTDLATGEIIGHRKTDTLQEIEHRVGLDFAQFSRSVLLAQGEFDTFIKAGAKERAELLERITGTHIYSRLSRLAFERARDAKESIKQFEAQARAHVPLSDEARAAAETARTSAQKSLIRLLAEQRQLEQAARWHETAGKLLAEVKCAQADRDRAAHEEAGAEELRAQAAQDLRALGLQSELLAQQATHRDHADAQQSHRAASSELAAATEDVSAAKLVLEAAADATKAAQLRLTALQPQFDAALQSDRDLEQARLVHKNTILKKATAEEAWQSARQSAETARDGTAQVEREFRAAEDWLAANAPAETVAAILPSLQSDLTRLADLQAKVAENTSWKQKSDAHATEAEALAEEQASAVTDYTKQLTAAEEKSNSLNATISAFDRAAEATQRSALEDVRNLLTQAATAAREHSKAQDDRQSAIDETAAQAKIAAEAELAFDDLSTRLHVIEARRTEAEISHQASALTASTAAEHLRATLQPGKPCPVCGATDHQLAETDIETLLRERLAQDQQRLAELDAIRKNMSEEKGIALTNHKVAMRLGKAAEIRHKKSGEEMTAAAAAWRRMQADISRYEARTGVVLGDHPASAADMRDVIADVKQRLLTISARLEIDAERQEDSRRMHLECEQLRTAREAALEKARQLRHDFSGFKAKAEKLLVRIEEASSETAHLTTQLDAVLGPAFPEWRASENPFVCVARIEADWRSRHLTAQALGPNLAARRTDLARLDAELAASARSREEAAAEEKEAASVALQKATERAQLLDGRSVEAVRTDCANEITKAEAKLSVAQNLFEIKTSNHAAAISAQRTTKDRVERSKSAVERADLTLSSRLSDENISLEDVAMAISRGAEDIDQTLNEYRRLSEVTRDAATVLRERAANMKEHEARDRPTLGAPEIQQGLDAAKQNAVAVSDEVDRTGGMIAADDEQRRLREAADQAVALRRQDSEVWTKLSDLIGSADGSRFRRYAQALTLEILVALANRHLADLHPRYELQRAPDGDMSLQVIDRNMADDVRGLHNLSGGERFLVSLALALGLASMSSGEGLRVETLFIDEGFGSLDQQSLGLAINALEQLQATGRQVGVISHVAELKERISTKIDLVPQGGGRSKIDISVS